MFIAFTFAVYKINLECSKLAFFFHLQVHVAAFHCIVPSINESLKFFGIPVNCKHFKCKILSTFTAYAAIDIVNYCQSCLSPHCVQFVFTAVRVTVYYVFVCIHVLFVVVLIV